MGVNMRAKFVIIASLVLTLAGCGPAESQAAPAAPEIQGEAPLAALQPGLAETMDGQRISTTHVIVTQLDIPELGNTMKDPFISGRFEGENIVLDEFLICDAGALMVEESCIALSALSAEKQELAVNFLIGIFDDHKCRIWEGFIAELARDDVLPENLAEYHVPCGITPPRDPFFSVKISL